MEVSKTPGLIESELEKHGSYASITKGTSMQPLFKTGRDAIVVVKPTRPLKKYDVVLYIGLTGKYTLHRIIGVKENEYLIRGDNTYTVEHIPKENVLGILTEFNRAGKQHTTTELSFRLYSRFWHLIYPIRAFYRRGRGWLGRHLKRKK